MLELAGLLLHGACAMTTFTVYSCELCGATYRHDDTEFCEVDARGMCRQLSEAGWGCVTLHIWSGNRYRGMRGGWLCPDHLR